MKLPARIAIVASGIVVGLACVEGAARVRDHGAFPHLNIYVEDPKLGVRLRPGATEKISFSGNPVTDVRINSAGYRGADWPAHADREILVVGDSQAFGLGVQEDKTFAARLGAALSRPVADAAVPTYGPDEYDATIAELLPKRKSTTVVYTINLANDLFEATRPNTTRHAVWDGWAVRKETAPASISAFPGRELFYRDSHAMFALRGLWFKAHANVDGALPSEGTWRDLESIGAKASADEKKSRDAAEAKRDERNQRLVKTRLLLQQLDEKLREPVFKATESFDGDLVDLAGGTGMLTAARANPGDIVRIYYGEGSRPVPLIADQIRLAATARQKLEANLRASHDTATLDALTKRDALEDEKRALSVDPKAALRDKSPLRAHLERVKKLCDDNGAELVVLVLPLDVMVSQGEWAKYHATPIDLSSTRVLADDILAVADAIGARAVDAWPALAAAEPGAFLDGDLHMTDKGHQAVADAIGKALAQPAHVHVGAQPMPLGRSAVPTPEEWKSAGPLPQSYGDWQGDAKRAGCVVNQVREWLRVACKDGRAELGTDVAAGSMAVNTDWGATIVVPIYEGSRFSFRVNRGGKMHIGAGVWGLEESSPETFMYEEHAKQPPAEITDAERALCACHRQVTGASDCSALYGTASPDCAKTFGSDCRALLLCARGDRDHAAVCGADRIADPSTMLCLPQPKPDAKK